MLEVGTHKCLIKDYGIIKPEGKTPSVVVLFSEIEEGDTIRWFGSFNGGAKEWTVKTLVETLGYKGKDGNDIAHGIGSHVLDEETEFEIVVELNHYFNPPKPTVKYINKPGASRQLEKLEEKEVKIVLGGLNLKGAFAEAKSQMPKEPKAPRKEKKAVEDDTDVPF